MSGFLPGLAPEERLVEDWSEEARRAAAAARKRKTLSLGIGEVADFGGVTVKRNSADGDANAMVVSRKQGYGERSPSPMWVDNAESAAAQLEMMGKAGANIHGGENPNNTFKGGGTYPDKRGVMPPGSDAPKAAKPAKTAEDSRLAVEKARHSWEKLKSQGIGFGFDRDSQKKHTEKRNKAYSKYTTLKAKHRETYGEEPVTGGRFPS